MLRIASLVGIFLFFLVAALAPYVSARGAALAFAQNPEERELPVFETLNEKLSLKASFVVLVDGTSYDLGYPIHLALKPQYCPEYQPKPPLA